MADVKIRFLGNKITDRNFEREDEIPDFKIERSFEFQSIRSEGNEQTETISEDDLIQLTTEDGLEWIGNIEEIEKIYGAKENHRGEGEYLFLSDEISISGSERGELGKRIKAKFLDIIKPVKSRLIKRVAETIDRKIVTKPGVYRVDKHMSLKPFTQKPNENKYLLLVHGFVNNVTGSFSGFIDFDAIHSRYNEAVIGLDHWTLSRSPIANAITFLEGIPENVELDILSQSRGGLVADVIGRCDRDNDHMGFTKDEISVFEEEGHKNIADEIEALIQLAAKKNIKVNRQVRVSCPASGTVLIDGRVEIFLNALFNAIKMATGGTSTILGIIKRLILNIAKQRKDANALPGLWACMPSSIYQQVNNNGFKVSSELYSIGGDAEFGGKLGQSLLVVLTNLYFLQANDFVVNTSAMHRGIINRKRHFSHTIENKEIQHFKYFNTVDSNLIVHEAIRGISTNFDDKTVESGQRGIALKLLDKEELGISPVSGNRPIVVMLPGIMGSSIYNSGERVWLDFQAINKGEMVDKMGIGIPRNDITTPTVIKDYYAPLKRALHAEYDVFVFPFDWRISAEEEGSRLETEIARLMKKGQNIHILAHSMGGLVVRSWMTNHRSTWENLKNAHNSKIIFFGTPWRGSHLIPEVLTGESSRIKQLGFLDFRYSKKSILKVVANYPGIYNLLPLQETFEKVDKWDEWLDVKNLKRADYIKQEQLDKFRKFRLKYEHARILDQDKDRIFYLAGWHKKTINGIESRTSRNGRKYLYFSKTREGDGSVTWALGIPEGLAPEHLYYTLIGHGNMMKDDRIFSGVKDILRIGKTTSNHFYKSKPSIALRSADSEELQDEVFIDYYKEENAIDRIFGTYDQSKKQDDRITLDVSVFNGDLKWSHYPVMIGHFEKDGIVSAERSLDNYLQGKLLERHSMGFYPSKIGEQAIIYNSTDTPCGAVVVGLGKKDGLTGYQLAETVEKAMLRYAIFFRDNSTGNGHDDVCQSISTLLIGSAYGKLPMQESIRSILLGIQNANATIIGMNNELKPITKVEFVDYYQDNAYECFKVLKTLETEKYIVKLKVNRDIESGFGNRKRLLRDESRSWWQSFTTEKKKHPKTGQDYLSYNSYSGLANVSNENVYSDLELATYFASRLSTNANWNEAESKTIFELLIPNSYKDFVRNHRNIEWRMDPYTAQFPWEMFHDYNFGKKPTFTEAGLIRQLILKSPPSAPALVNSNTALVIGDPEYNTKGLGQLNGALKEAKTVHGILRKNNIKSDLLTRSNPVSIMKHLYANKYKILHIAAHGFFDPEHDKVGIAIGDGKILSPGTIRQLSSIPEFVFINCCHSGKIDAELENYNNNRNQLAANVGTELIRMGVKAVVVTGWAVHDGAARLFAETLYENLYQGEYFGDAIRNARKSCYESYPEYNTWGAYQCYGDQFYRLSRKNGNEGDEGIPAIESEIIIELENLISKTENISINGSNGFRIHGIFDRVEKIIRNAIDLGIYSCEIREHEFGILSNLGRYKAAIRVFEGILLDPCLDYSVSNVIKYHNIRSKDLARDFLGEKVLYKQASASYVEKIRQVIQQVQKFPISSKSADYFSTLASTYKRAALLDEENKWNHLEKACQHYSTAAKLKGMNNKDSIYYVTSFITIKNLISQSGQKRDDKNKTAQLNWDKTGKGIDSAKAYITHWLKVIHETRTSRNNMWDHLSRIQLLNCSHIIGLNIANAEPDKIIALYEEQFKLRIRVRDIFGEQEFIEFVLALVPDIENDLGKGLCKILQYLRKVVA